MAGSAIQWTTATWNPTVGCDKVSEGCRNCYAMRLAPRLAAMGQADYEGLTRKMPDGSVNWTGTVRTLPERLGIPLTWKKPKRIFVDSMSDLFHEDVPDEFIERVFGAMAVAHWHTFQVLTKRPARMLAFLSLPGVVRRICEAAYRLHMAAYATTAAEFTPAASRSFRRQMKAWWGHDGALTAWTVKGGAAAEVFERYEPGREYPSRLAWPLPNVWLGVSVEDQRAADERIPLLLQTPAAVRFLSCEPLLGRIELSDVSGWRDAPRWLGRMNLGPDAISWVIAGGESGPKFRPMDLDWARSLRDQCRAAGVAFFYKQSSGPRHGMHRELDGRMWEEFPTPRELANV